jgi:hypothetical protein
VQVTNKPCTRDAAVSLANDTYKLSFNWDGVDDNAKIAPDGVYEIIVKAFDKAGNESVNLSGNNFVVIDTTANATNISYPKVNGFTNSTENTIAGGLYTILGGNNNSDKLEISKDLVSTTTGSTSYAFKPVSLNPSSNFKLDTVGFGALNLGLNKFTFRNTDKLGNTKEDVVQFSVEKTAPSITSIPQTTYQGSSNFSFTLQDNRPAGQTNDDQVSGLPTGTNPGGYDISLIRLKEDKTTFDKEIPLFRDAQPITDPTSNKKLADQINCVASTTYSTNKTSPVTCTFAVNGLTLDGNYILYIKAEDTAGNQVCTSLPASSQIDSTILCGSGANTFVNTSITNVKTSFYYNLTSIAKSQTTKDNYTILQGKAEKGQIYKVANTEQNRYTTFTLDTTSNNLKSTEYDLTTGAVTATQGSDTGRVLIPNTLNITCTGEKLDIDNNSTTEPVEVCNFSYRMNLKTGTPITTTTAPITTTTPAQPNQITTTMPNQTGFPVDTRTITVNQAGINLSVSPNYTAFSPNGDSKYDTISFTNTVTDKDTGGTIIYPMGDYRATIKDSTGTTVWEAGNSGIYGTSINAIPTNITWNGTRNQNPTATSLLNSILPDNTYTYQLKVKLPSGVEYTSSTQSIQIINQMTGNEKPVILSPKQNYTTTKGIINIQGIAPQSTTQTINNITSPLRTWKANICLDKLPADGICEVTSRQTTETTSPSFYALLTVPQSTVKTDYLIKVTSEDNAGNQSPTSDPLTFTVEGNQSITTTATSNLTGTNTPEQILAFIDQKPTPLYKDTTLSQSPYT